MAIVLDLLDRLRMLQQNRERWFTHWRDVARYSVLEAEEMDVLGAWNASWARADNVPGPVAAERSREVYDTTSLWAIDRGTAGTMSLVTPQAGTWHDLDSDDPFGGEANDEESRWYEKVRDYQFRTRANPRSGFWPAHKAAIRSVWGFGTAVVFIGESDRDASSPISYAFIPLSENHLAVNFEGVVDTNFRLFHRSARQCVERWGTKCSAKTRDKANDPKQKDKMIPILHAVYPRNEGKGSYSAGLRTKLQMPFASCIVEPDEKHLVGESGFEEFPYRVDHWQRNGTGPYSTGPVALALAEIKSLNMLAKSELRAAQQWTDPPLATHEDNGTRINLNPRAQNPGYVNAQGRLLVQPIITAQRPDFAQSVLEVRRNAVRETLYVNLWQILISNPNMTATEAMIRANEKGDLLGPVGSSLQTGLSFQIDREIGILGRRRAFAPGSPLAAPKSIYNNGISARFTSPLDKMRRIPQLQGMTQLIPIIGAIAEIQIKSGEPPTVLDKVNPDEMLDLAQDILGVPRKIMTADDELAAKRAARQQQMTQAAGIESTRAAGEAATAGAEGAQAIADNPAAYEIMKRVAGVTGVAA